MSSTPSRGDQAPTSSHNHPALQGTPVSSQFGWPPERIQPTERQANRQANRQAPHTDRPSASHIATRQGNRKDVYANNADADSLHLAASHRLRSETLEPPTRHLSDSDCPLRCNMGMGR